MLEDIIRKKLTWVFTLLFFESILIISVAPKSDLLWAALFFNALLCYLTIPATVSYTITTSSMTFFNQFLPEYSFMGIFFGILASAFTVAVYFFLLHFLKRSPLQIVVLLTIVTMAMAVMSAMGFVSIYMRYV